MRIIKRKIIKPLTQAGRSVRGQVNKQLYIILTLLIKIHR